MLKDYLEKNGMEYEEKLVDQDEEARDYMLKKSGGFLGVPFTVIENNGEVETVIGFDKGKVDELLDIN